MPVTSTGAHDINQASISSTSDSSMNVVEGIRDIADHYDLFLRDMWGVLHDGSTPYEGVLETIRKLKQAGKDLIILSNSSKRNNHSVISLRKLGFNPEDFQQIITSGELAFQMLAETCQPSLSWPHLSRLNAGGQEMRKVIVLGSGDGDEEYCNSCGWTLSNVNEANLVLARGTFTINDGSSNVVEKNANESRYEQALSKLLEEAAKRKLPMLVSNPDKVRPDNERPPMPGSIGDAYERALGGGVEAETLVKRVGKPFRDVYDLALERTSVHPTRVCMVGDALETDVTGGSAVGIATIWIVKDGIHSPDIDQKGKGSLHDGAMLVLQEFNENHSTYAKGRQLQPTTVIPHFRW
jgi:HAD superfamily hydrolase (TIGR01450 family)